jgi:hypothetical protein
LNDINALQSCNQGVTPPSNPSPGACWLDTSGVTVYSLKWFDGRGNAWLLAATLDTVNNIWEPPVGGGLLPTLLSAATTDLGSVPQASVHIAGNNPIQSFGATAPPGTIKFIVFDGAATLVHTPNVLHTGGSNITQAPGDTAIALQISQGDWKIVFDSRAPAVARIRTVLNSTGNLYVATTGSDLNNNCSDALTPCQTIQQACTIAMANYDLGGQQLLINVANGTYAAGCNLAGQLVGTATASPAPSIQFPITGLQIIGNPSSPSSVIIADTSSPAFAPAVFSAAAGAYFTVSGFTVSSVNGRALLAEGPSLLQFGNMVFGNSGLASITAHSNAVVYGFANFTIAGSAPSAFATTSGGLLRLGQSTPMTVTFSGTPNFPSATANITGGSRFISDAGIVMMTGAAIGPRFFIKEDSLIDTNTGSPTYFPGNVNGAVKDYSVYSPMPRVVTFTTQTGIGTGGSVTPDPTVGAVMDGGQIDITAGTGAASSGEVVFLQPTEQSRVCIPTLDNLNWAAGATVRSAHNQLTDRTSFDWNNNGVALTNGVQYNILYTCFGLHP